MRSTCVKIIISLLLIFSPHNAISQDWHWAWAKSVKQYDGNGLNMKLLHVDCLNNSYQQYIYPDSIFFPDTAFTHPGLLPGFNNLAIGIFDGEGDFLKALDFSRIGESYIYSASVTTDTLMNIYVLLSFFGEIQVEDSLIGMLPFSSNNFVTTCLIKYSSGTEVQWIKTISGTSSVYNAGIQSTNGNNLVICSEINPYYPYLPDTTYYFGQDTIYSSHFCSIISKLDLDGNVIWTDLIFTEDYGLYAHFKIGTDDNIYYFGNVYSALVAGGDTIFCPDTRWTYPFIVKYDDQGKYDFGVVKNWKLYLTDLQISRSGDIFLSGDFPDTLNFGTAVIIVGGDTVSSIICRLDQNLDPSWYSIAKCLNAIYFNHLEIYLDTDCDSLIFTILFSGKLFLDNQLFSANLAPYTSLVGMFSPNGNLVHTLLTKSTNSILIRGIKSDHCGNLIIYGSHKGFSVFDNDTLINYSNYYESFFAKIERYKLIPFSLGSDTIIKKSHHLTLEIPGNYNRYLWSTNDTTQSIELTGEELGLGDHTIWARAYTGSCYSYDEIGLNVLDDYGIDETRKIDFVIYPNPAKNEVKIEMLNTPVEPETKLSIIGATGNEIINCKFSDNTTSINTSSLPPGLYFVRLSNNKTVEVGKFVKL